MIDKEAYWYKWYLAHPDYHRDWAKRKRDRFHILINKLKEKPCSDCRGFYDPICMDFDHIDPKTKVKDIARLSNTNVSLKRLLHEIGKCELVCSNCHRVRTKKRLLKSDYEGLE